MRLPLELPYPPPRHGADRDDLDLDVVLVSWSRYARGYWTPQPVEAVPGDQCRDDIDAERWIAREIGLDLDAVQVTGFKFCSPGYAPRHAAGGRP